MNKSVLLLAASEKELNSVVSDRGEGSLQFGPALPGIDITGMVSGIGMVNTTWSLMDYLSKNPTPDLILNIGIAGTFRNDIPLGEVLVVESDCFADLGIEERDGFKTIWEAGLASADIFPFEDGLLLPAADILPKTGKKFRTAKAITVNTVSGTEQTIRNLESNFNPG